MDIQLKIVLLGEGGVGKTSLVRRYVKHMFDESSIRSTTKVYFEKKLIKVDLDTVILNIWDTGGQERYRALQPMYYRGAHGALLVYSANDRQTFDRVKTWIVELKKFVGDDIVIAVAASKVDLFSERQVKKDVAEKFCKKLGVKHWETSSKANKNVNSCFLDIVKQVVKKEKQKRENRKTSETFSSGSFGYQSNSLTVGGGGVKRKKNEILIAEDDDLRPGPYEKNCCC